MRVAFCLSPRLPGRGLRKGRRPIAITCINSIGSLRSVLLRFLRKGNGSPSTSNSAKETLPVWMSEYFSRICSSIFGGPSFFYGTEDQSIAVKRLRSFWLAIRDFVPFSSQLMPRNSIRQSMFGTKLIVLFATAPRRICQSLKDCSAIQCEDCGDPQNFFGHASMLRIFRGQDRSFHYLCEGQ